MASVVGDGFTVSRRPKPDRGELHVQEPLGCDSDVLPRYVRVDKRD